MTSTAKRRWSRELETQIDGIAFAATGPVVLHGYEAPAGGKWIDSVIPGRLMAFDRNAGDLLWRVPCEVGYGRGFGAGIVAEDRIVVLGPSLAGHRICHMSLSDGELIDAAEIEPFDEALVGPDLCIGATAARVWGIDTSNMVGAWEYSREGERYHHVERVGDRVLVVFSHSGRPGQGILRLDAETGEHEGNLLEPSQPVIHGLAGGGEMLVALTCDLARSLSPEAQESLEMELAEHLGGGLSDTLSLLALRIDGELGDDASWHRVLETRELDELPEASILMDNEKLYLERGAHLQAIDGWSGRALGEWAVPGLDERVDWRVVDGAGLLAEETRVSVFELPA